jgi:hypothetical protein
VLKAVGVKDKIWFSYGPELRLKPNVQSSADTGGGSYARSMDFVSDYTMTEQSFSTFNFYKL